MLINARGVVSLEIQNCEESLESCGIEKINMHRMITLGNNLLVGLWSDGYG